MREGRDERRVLFVDDDVSFVERLSRIVGRNAEEVHTAFTVDEALELARMFRPTHAVVDLRIGQQRGIELVLPLVSNYNARVVILTGYGSISTTIEAVRCGAVNYLTKPVSASEVENALFGEPFTSVSRKDSFPTPSLDEVEWEHIQRVLRDCGGNITHAAKELGLHRQALQRKLRSSRPPQE